MEFPNIKTTVLDAEKKITYHVAAYRKLSDHEALNAVRFFLSTQKKKPKSGSTVTIITSIR